MTLFVLDTDTLTLVQEGHPAVCEQFLRQPPDAVAITVLSVEEQLSGWYTQVHKAREPARLAWAYRRLSDNDRFLARLQILTYDEAAMHRFEQLRRQKVKIGRTDLRIAATVLECAATLVTDNAHDFQRVPGFAFVSWSGRV